MLLTKRAWLMGFAALAASPALAQAARDPAAEAYTAEKLPAAMAALSDPKLDLAGRDAKFAALMDQLADMTRVSDFVLGRYARDARANPALYQEWVQAFRAYATAVYQDQLDQYRGAQVKVTGSRVRAPGDVVVNTEIPQRNAPPFQAQWRLLGDAAKGYRVVDVAVKLEDQVIWLAIQQRADFQAFLGKNGGSLKALIGEVRRQTAEMRANIAARNAKPRRT